MSENRLKISLTRGEEEIMQALWSIGEGYIADIISRMPDPKPKYTTAATFLKILEQKGAVARTRTGKLYIYTPLLTREDYAYTLMGSMLGDYFGGSLAQMVSFFSRRENISTSEMDEIIETMQQIKK